MWGVVALEYALRRVSHVEATGFPELQASEEVDCDAAVMESFGVFFNFIPVGGAVVCLQGSVCVEVEDSACRNPHAATSEFLAYQQRDAEAEHFDSGTAWFDLFRVDIGFNATFSVEIHPVDDCHFVVAPVETETERHTESTVDIFNSQRIYP